MRDDFTERTKRILALRVANRCSNPLCRKMTSGPAAQIDESVNIGEAAHIAAAAPGGKRYDPQMTSAQRSSIENGIWLCRTCAALIDDSGAKIWETKVSLKPQLKLFEFLFENLS